VLGSGGYCWIRVVDDKRAPHFQQTAKVGGLLLPQLGQIGLFNIVRVDRTRADQGACLSYENKLVRPSGSDEEFCYCTVLSCPAFLLLGTPAMALDHNSVGRALKESMVIESSPAIMAMRRTLSVTLLVRASSLTGCIPGKWVFVLTHAHTSTITGVRTSHIWE